MSLYDENAWVLNDLAGRGSDLSRAKAVDFAHVFPSRALADIFAREVEGIGFTTSVNRTERKDDPWDVIATKVMVPACEGVTQVEEERGDIARTHKGRPDGWGFLDE